MISNYDYLGGCYRRFCRRAICQAFKASHVRHANWANYHFLVPPLQQACTPSTRRSEPERLILCIVNTHHQVYQHPYQHCTERFNMMKRAAFNSKQGMKLKPPQYSILQNQEPTKASALLIPSHASRFNQIVNISSNLTDSVTYSLPNH